MYMYMFIIIDVMCDKMMKSSFYWCKNANLHLYLCLLNPNYDVYLLFASHCFLIRLI